MLSHITWQGYWVTLAILTLLYYFVIFFLYYKNLLPASKIPSAGRMESKGSAPEDGPEAEHRFVPVATDFDDSPFELPAEGSDEYMAYALMDKLSAYLLQAKKTKVVKEELIYALQTICSKYPSLRNSPYKESISNVLVSECEHSCSVQLSGEEVGVVWLAQ